VGRRGGLLVSFVFAGVATASPAAVRQIAVGERRGREQIVRCNVPTLRKAAALLDAYEQLWIARTTQIADILAGEDGSPT
jgi:urease accessory protein UreF